ncbi:hypothetical protein [Methanobrevibacter sp.]|uniref:hypothetical protein n=1 Tax=Methanobrevibacter sp. TaxID=66852 RepID=UPI00388DF8DD
MKYEFLLSSNYKNLFKLFRFMTHDLPVSSINENCNLSVENEIFNDSSINISQFIKESPMIKSVIKVFF